MTEPDIDAEAVMFAVDILTENLPDTEWLVLATECPVCGDVHGQVMGLGGSSKEVHHR